MNNDQDSERIGEQPMMVNRAECECGNQIDYIVKDGPLRCFHCGTEMETVGKVGCVTGVADDMIPKSELEALADEWVSAADVFDGPDERDKIKAANIRKCAQELWELLEGHE